MAAKVRWRVYRAPEGSGLSYCGEFEELTDAHACAQGNPFGQHESLWDTLRAAGDAFRFHAPRPDGVEADEVEAWYGEHCVVRVTYREDKDAQ